MTRRKVIAALAGFLLYGCVIGFLPLPDRLILFPTTQRIDAGAAQRRAIPFRGGEVEVWCATSERARVAGKPELYVLRFYGNADRAERWVADEAEMMSDRVVEVWGMNYPGFGGSTGPARLESLGPAALAAFDELKRVAGDRPIIASGASLGTVTALHVAAERPVAGAILHNPPALRQMILGEFGWWNLWLLAGPLAQRIPPALDSVANARVAHVRAIFMLAEKDEIVSPKYQSLVVNAYAGEKRVISLAGANHNSPVEAAALTELYGSLEWLLEKRADTAVQPE